MINSEAFLRNIYKKGSFEGHAFCCSPQLSSLAQTGDFTLSSKPVDNWLPQIIKSYDEFVRLHEKINDDSVPFAKINTGTHIFAAAFGCKVHCPADDMPFALPLADSCEQVQKLALPDIWKSPTLYKVFEMIEKVRNELGPDAYISVPDMQSGFDTAALVWTKENLYCSMLEKPEIVKEFVRKCSNLVKTFVEQLRREFTNITPCHCPIVWAPPEMGPWLSNDECGVLSPQMFEEFCLPELVDFARQFGGMGMHCCADAEHQFKLFQNIPGFYAFNRVAGKNGFEPILESFSGPNAPVHAISWISDGEIINLANKACHGTRFIFNLVNTNVDEGCEWYQRMKNTCGRM